MENIKNTDEADLLGYFETIKSVFLLKLLFLVSVTKEENGKRFLELPVELTNVISELENQFDEPLFFKALKLGNEELISNYLEDIITSATSSSWNVFEQIIKTLTYGDYSEEIQQMPVNYESGKFQFTKREKKDIDLFYYLRNSMAHYNGAYYAYRTINHSYRGWSFKSEGNIGNKIIISPKAVYSIICDLESYSAKAWNNANEL